MLWIFQFYTINFILIHLDLHYLLLQNKINQIIRNINKSYNKFTKFIQIKCITIFVFMEKICEIN